jgi:hypothetical protein
MGNKVLISAAVGVLVGAAAVLLFRPATLIKVVSVTSNAPNPPRLSINPLQIKDDQVQWQAIPPSMIEYIEFEQKVFANAIFTNGRYRVKCNGGICDSGAALQTLPTQPVDGYKYWYGLATSSTPQPNWGTDGHVVIVRP